MTLSRLLAVKLVVLLVWSVPSISNSTTSACARLLSVGSGASSAYDERLKVSQDAAVFLNLVDLGIANLGTEAPALLRNLKELGGSEYPLNPFLNLRTPLGLKLADRAEPLVADLFADWSAIRLRITERAKLKSKEQIDRAEDSKKTRAVVHPIEVPVQLLPGDPQKLSKIRFIGETNEYMIFATEPDFEGDAGLVIKVIRLSKETLKSKVILHIPVPDRHAHSQWMHDGVLYGMGHIRFSNSPSETPSVGIFRIDPKTLKLEWTKDRWEQDDSLGQPVRMSRFVYGLNSVIGIDMIKNPRTNEHDGGHVYKLDYDQFRLVSTGLVLKYRSAAWTGRKTMQTYFHSSTDGGAAVRFGRLFKTDGTVIVQAGDSTEWKHWSSSEALVSREKKLSDSRLEVSLHEPQIDFDALDLDTFERGKVLPVTPRDPVQFEVPAGVSTSEAFESFDNGASILYMMKIGEVLDQQIRLLLIDRDSWTAKEVALSSGPQAHRKGSWQFFRTKKDDLLLRFDAGAEEVALWKFDPRTRNFELKLHEFFNGKEGNEPTRVVLDYENLKIAAWIYKPTVFSMETVRVYMDRNLSRDGAASESQKVSP